MKKFRLFYLFIVVFNCTCTGQVLWSLKAEQNNFYTNVKQLPNKNFVALSYFGNVIQLDTLGNLLWSKNHYAAGWLNWTPSAFDICSDNGVVISAVAANAGQSQKVNLQIMKLDSLGDVVWTFSPADSVLGGISLISTRDSGVIIQFILPFISGTITTKLDKSGNFVWSRTLSTAGELCATDDNGFVMLNMGNSRINLMKFDQAGNFQWAKEYSVFSVYDLAYGAAVSQTSDGGYAVFSALSDWDTYLGGYFLKLDSLGVPQFSKSIDSDTYSFPDTPPIETSGGDFVLTDFFYNKIILNNNGTFKDAKSIFYQGKTCLTHDFGFISTDNNGYITKFDSSFNSCCASSASLFVSVTNVFTSASSFSVTGSSFSYIYNSPTALDTVSTGFQKLCTNIESPGPFSVKSNDTLPICRNQYKGLYLEPLNSCYNYQWKFNGTDIANENNSSMWANDSGYYSCLISNGIGTFLTDSILVVVHDLPAVNLNSAGIPRLCTGDSISLYTDSSAVSWLWSPGGQSTASIYVNAAGTYSVTATNTYGCTKTQQIFIAMDSVAPSYDTLIYNGKNCYNSQQVFDLVYAWQPYYLQWMQDSIVIGGATSGHFWFHLLNEGNYYCTIENGCGQINTDSVHLVPNQLPVPSIYPDTSITLCKGDSIAISTADCSTCLWSYSLNGQFFYKYADTLYVDTANIYTLTCVDSIGCNSLTPVVVSLAGSTVTNATHNDSLCYQATSILLDCQPSGGVYSGNAIVIDHFDPFFAIEGWNQYQYSYTDSSGCTTELMDSIRVYKPSIIQSANDDSLCTSSLPFFLNCIPAGGIYSGSAISGSQFVPSAGVTGWNPFQYLYTDNLGCSAISADSVYLTTCTALSEVSVHKFNFYPNPFKNEIFIENNLTEECIVTVYSVQGKMVIQWKLEGKQSGKFAFTFSPGIYLLDVNRGDFHSKYNLMKVE